MKKENSSRRIFNRIDTILLTLIILIGFCLRLYKYDTPLADLHSWRQVDTAAVARNFVKDGFDLMHPRYDDLSNFQSGLENPNGYRFVEFPIYSALFGFTYTLFPQLPIEVHGRLWSIIFSLIIIGVIYYLALKEYNRLAAAVSAFTFATLPVIIFFSRVVLPEVMATSLAFIAIFSAYKFKDNQEKESYMWLIFGIVSFAAGLLVKPTVIFFALPILYIFFEKYGLAIYKKAAVYVFFILSAIPLIWWRKYITQFPEGIPASSWLITHVNTYEGQKNIFFKPAFFRWIFFERINNITFGGYLTFLFVLGVLGNTRKYFIHTILAASILYLLVFQGGNVQHEYYQILIYPALALFVGIGTSFLFTQSKAFIHPILSFITVLVIFGLSYYFSYFKVQDWYHIPNDLLQMADIIKTFTRADSRIVTDRSGDTTLLYLADRKGAPGIYKSVPELKQLGYEYLISASKEERDKIKLEKTGTPVFDNDQFTLFKL